MPTEKTNVAIPNLVIFSGRPCIRILHDSKSRFELARYSHSQLSTDVPFSAYPVTGTVALLNNTSDRRHGAPPARHGYCLHVTVGRSIGYHSRKSIQVSSRHDEDLTDASKHAQSSKQCKYMSIPPMDHGNLCKAISCAAHPVQKLEQPNLNQKPQ